MSIWRHGNSMCARERGRVSYCSHMEKYAFDCAEVPYARGRERVFPILPLWKNMSLTARERARQFYMCARERARGRVDLYYSVNSVNGNGFARIVDRVT
ncbi:MAG: hypothetical protein RR059_06545 [Clostridia bacterium]